MAPGLFDAAVKEAQRTGAGDGGLLKQLESKAGELVQKGADDPEDLFKVGQVVAGDKTAPPETETGCKLQWPA